MARSEPLGATVFRRLVDRHSNQTDNLIRIYEEAIPSYERKSADAVREMVASSRHHVVVAVDGVEVVGFAILYRGTSVSLLEYLAVDEKMRGRRLGQSLFKEARSAAGQLPLIIEVEPECSFCDNSEQRSRRIQFYRRLGCRRISGMEFILPIGGADTRLDLLIASGRETLLGSEVAAWLREIYAEVYGCRKDDQRLAEMIACLPALIDLD